MQHSGRGRSSLQMRVVPQYASHMDISRFPTSSGLLDFLMFDHWPCIEILVLARRSNTRLFELLRHGVIIRNLDLLPNLAELRVKMLDERRVVGPNHLGMIVLFVSRNE